MPDPFKRTDLHVCLVTLVYLQPFKEARASLESQLKRKEEELRKANDSRDNIMKTMREALEVAKAHKAEYDVKLATVRQQCREEMRREMDEEMRRTKRDFQKQLDDKDRSLEEVKCVEKTKPVSKTSESSKSSSSSSVSKPNANSVEKYTDRDFYRRLQRQRRHKRTPNSTFMSSGNETLC